MLSEHEMPEELKTPNRASVEDAQEDVENHMNHCREHARIAEEIIGVVRCWQRPASPRQRLIHSCSASTLSMN